MTHDDDRSPWQRDLDRLVAAREDVVAAVVEALHLQRIADWFTRVGLVGPALIVVGVALILLADWMGGRAV